MVSVYNEILEANEELPSYVFDYLQKGNTITRMTNRREITIRLEQNRLIEVTND